MAYHSENFGNFATIIANVHGVYAEQQYWTKRLSDERRYSGLRGWRRAIGIRANQGQRMAVGILP
jgi:hypothetical protein|tara:strand:+ start:68 stop:262 length:195 start_codon:yes stop_codon:yes gene_type:complete